MDRIMTEDLKQWLETAEPGCLAADLPFLALEDTFVSGDASGLRLNIRYYQRQDDLALRGKVIFGPGTQGPPDHAHGGSQAALLDEAMGGAAWLAGHPVVAASLNISFLKMLPLNTPCFVEAHVTAVDGRKVSTTGAIRSRDGQTTYSEGTALFIALDRNRIEGLSAKAGPIVERMRKRQD
jgi:acyl-coenzyme A thioesterase PaaI-like protein